MITEIGIVSGKVLELGPNFTPGSLVRQGEVLVKLDPADYSIAVQQRQSAVDRARANLALEMGSQEVAPEAPRIGINKLLFDTSLCKPAHMEAFTPSGIASEWHSEGQGFESPHLH